MNSRFNFTRPDLDAAVEHACWVAARQAQGHWLLLKAMSNCANGLTSADAIYLQNDSQRLAADARSGLRDWLRSEYHIFYSVNGFREQRALKECVVPGRLAQVDADGVVLPPPGPQPTRIVRTSPGNHQFLYELDRFPESHQLESISRYLTRLVGGDRGGHQLAKLLRLPGTINWKLEYSPNPLVTVVPYGG